MRIRIEAAVKGKATVEAKKKKTRKIDESKTKEKKLKERVRPSGDVFTESDKKLKFKRLAKVTNFSHKKHECEVKIIKEI